MRRGTKIWKPRREYLGLLLKAIQLFPTLLGHIKPERIFLCGFQSRRSRHIARITSNRYPWSLLLKDYDYAIEFWETRFVRESDEMKLFIVVHELLHIPLGGFTKYGPKYKRILKHDLEDFQFLRTVYGIELENVKDIYKGEKALLPKHGQIRRFPRLIKMG